VAAGQAHGTVGVRIGQAAGGEVVIVEVRRARCCEWGLRCADFRTQP
jgi:hypothetical protein